MSWVTLTQADEQKQDKINAFVAYFFAIAEKVVHLTSNFQTF